MPETPPPVDATGPDTSTAEPLPAHLAAMVPDTSIDGTEGLLGYLAARMLRAPDSIVRRIAEADAIVLGTVRRSEVIGHSPSPAFLADPAVRDRAIDGPGGRLYFVSLVEITPERWLRGTRRKVAKGVWEAPQDDDSTVAGLPGVGERGIVLFAPLPATTVGRELARAVRGAAAITPFDPVVLTDDDGQLARALAVKPAALAQALGELRGGALQVLLGSLVEARSKDTIVALQARVRGAAVDADTLLVRAALYELGERAFAIDGLDALTIDGDVLHGFGIVSLEHAGNRLGLSGPAITKGLPW